eukprot:1672361-Amphidinium_carterae.1
MLPKRPALLALQIREVESSLDFVHLPETTLNHTHVRTNLKRSFRQHLRWQLKRGGPARPQVSAAGHGARPQDADDASLQPEAKSF